MNRIRTQSTAKVFAAILAVMILGGCNGGGSDEEGVPKFKEISIGRGTFHVSVSANGEVKPIDRIEMKSKASGTIVDLSIEEGDSVRKGDLIARLDQKDEQAAVDQARADLNIANAELKQAQRTFDRRDELFQRNFISEEERDEIELSLAVAKGKLIQAETSLDRAEERLAEATVRAPIDGVILQKYVEEGQIIVSGISNVSGGTAIADIADMRKVQVEAGIDEIDIGKIKVGQSASVIADAYPGIRFDGTIVRIAPEAKVEQNVTLFDIIVEVDNPEAKLKSGMNATVDITIVQKENVLLAPSVAVLGQQERGGDNGGAYVLLKKDGRFEKHAVETGLSSFRDVEILSGLEEGDIVGVAMTSRLKAENDRLEERIKSSRSFGTTNNSSSNKKKPQGN